MIYNEDCLTTMARLEDELGHTVLKEKSLRELKETDGRDEKDFEISCSIYCGEVLNNL